MRHSIFFIIFIIFISGCAYKKPLIKLETKQTMSDVEYKLILQRFREHYFPLKNKKLTYPEDIDKEKRNQILNDLLILSDLRYKRWKNKIKYSSDIPNSIVDVLAIGLSATATLTTGDLSQIFAGSTTALLGMQESVNKRLLANQTLETIIQAIELERLKKRQEIFINLDKEADKYSLSAGVRDINYYDMLVSIPNGLNFIAKKIGSEKVKEEEILRQINIATDKQKAYLKNKSIINQGLNQIEGTTSSL